MTGGGFISGLPVSEMLLARDAGFEPAGVVMGSSVCHLDIPPAVKSAANLISPSAATASTFIPVDGGEVLELSRAVDMAGSLALTRLEDDTRALDADGVIGITVEINWDSWYDGALEYMLTGTAIRRSRSDAPPSATDSTVPRAGTDGPVFTCDLSGRDFWSLLRSGFQVLGLVTGYCAYGAAPDFTGTNRELRGPTRAVYAARELAMNRMRSQATGLGAAGIVGTRIGGLDGLGRLPRRRVMEFLATGTAIATIPGVPGAPTPVPVLSL